ncbi:hypothetical protein AVEN_6009-1 [Araneus ventricosus]|uniref:SOCS box domain-containing protein n=1 Tax=Araneus ventricosus TaxID=182803 RepID=A0A4Y2RYY6_ARAVE|nr:hypothetical protein AVEN_6009-1 [Araneus ventricosus]
MEYFSSKLEHRSVELTCVADIIQFSAIVRKSIVHLDLKLSEYCAVQGNCGTLSYGSMLSSTYDFISTQEKCRKILTPSRNLLYSLHLDFPRQREYSLMEKRKCGSFSRYYRVPHISDIYYRSDLFVGMLSDFIHYAVNHTDERLKVFNWLLKFEIVKESQFHLLHHSIVNNILNCLHLHNIDSTMLKEFYKKFFFNYWMYKYENPEILEYFLYNARRVGRNFETDRPRNYDLTDVCISKGYFLNIAPILKCIDSPRLSGPYGTYLFQPQYVR